MNDIGNHRGGL